METLEIGLDVVAAMTRVLTLVHRQACAGDPRSAILAGMMKVVLARICHKVEQSGQATQSQIMATMDFHRVDVLERDRNGEYNQQDFNSDQEFIMKSGWENL